MIWLWPGRELLLTWSDWPDSDLSLPSTDLVDIFYWSGRDLGETCESFGTWELPDSYPADTSLLSVTVWLKVVTFLRSYYTVTTPLPEVRNMHRLVCIQFFSRQLRRKFGNFRALWLVVWHREWRRFFFSLPLVVKHMDDYHEQPSGAQRRIQVATSLVQVATLLGALGPAKDPPGKGGGCQRGSTNRRPWALLPLDKSAPWHFVPPFEKLLNSRSL